jgi:hypothetical protein
MYARKHPREEEPNEESAARKVDQMENDLV